MPLMPTYMFNIQTYVSWVWGLGFRHHKKWCPLMTTPWVHSIFLNMHPFIGFEAWVCITEQSVTVGGQIFGIIHLIHTQQAINLNPVAKAMV